jgi:glycerophosphodiester phosphodiesterase
MKFGRQFDFHKIPEWSEFYLDYKELKKSLKNIQKIRRKSKIIL